MPEDNKTNNQVPAKSTGPVLSNSNIASTGDVKQTTQTSPSNPAQLNSSSAQNSTSAKKSSSPWEEDLDLPEEIDKKQPKVIGTLDPRDSVGGQKAFAVPPNIDEKVGKKIPASEVIENSKPQNSIPVQAINPNSPKEPAVKPVPQNNPIAETNIDISPKTTTTPASPIPPKPISNSVPVPAPNPTSKITSTPIDSFDDFDWFGTGLGEETDKKSSTTTVPAQPNPATNSLKKQIDITKPPVVNPEPIQNSPAEPAPVVDVPLKPAEPSVLDSNVSENPAPLDEPIKPETSQDIPVPVSSELPEANKRRFPLPSLNGKLIILVLGVLLLVFVSLSALTEFGLLGIGFEKIYGSIGIEQIWKGLSKNPEKAILRSYSAMKNHPNFKARGELSLTIDGTIKSEITSPLVGTTLEDLINTKIVNSTLEFKNNENMSEAVFLVSSETGDNKITLINKDDKLYVNGNENISYKNNKDENKWSAYTIGSLKDKNIQKDFFNLNSNQELSVEGIRVGSEKINDEMSYKYSLASIEIGNMLASFGITSDMIQTASGDIWIGVKSKFIRRLALKINTPTSSSVSQINLDINFYDYDVTNDIKEVDSTAIVEEQTIKTGDQKRKTDVETILSALKEYKDANGSYPNSSDKLVPLNTSENIVKSALVPTYLSELPVDENDLFGWYYAYKSNGTTCSVSSRLENTDDPEGQMANNLILYIKYNSD